MAIKKSATAALFKELQQCTNYRSFLKTYLEGRSLSLADFARAAGFGRSFPSDVLSGKRRLTAKSVYGFEKALKIPLSGKKLFRLLVANEETDIFPELNREQLPSAIRELQTKSWQAEHQKIKESESKSLAEILSNSEAMAIYAAAGDPERGASFEEIEKRTRIFGRELEKNLRLLADADFLEHRGDVYFPKDLHTFMLTQDRSQLLTQVFQKSCRAALERVANREDKSEMFFSSNLCVREESMPELKAALRELILKFVDEATHPGGDRVVRLLTTLHF